MFYYKLPLFVLCGFISACSFNQSRFTPVEPDDENLATVYIYRPAALSNFMISPKILLNNKELFTLAAGRYDYTHLNAGTYEFRLDLGKRFTGSRQIEMKVETGKTYYLKVNTSLHFEKNAPYTRRFNILSMKHEEALDEISLTQPEAPKNKQMVITVDNTAPADDTHQHSPQFDLSKTRNPFNN